MTVQGDAAMRRKDTNLAAQVLLDARRSHYQIDGLPITLRPSTLFEGYEIQDAVTRLSEQTPVGWKIGATGQPAQRRVGALEPFYGPVLQDEVYKHGAEIPTSVSVLKALQVEFVLTVRRDLCDPPHLLTVDVVREAVQGVRAGVEIADCRFRDWTTVGVASLVADGAKGGLVVLGTKELPLSAVDLPSHDVSLHVNGRLVAKSNGASVMGDPIYSLQWAARAMSARGRPLRAGAFVFTGTCTGSYPAHATDYVLADFGSLGNVWFTFHT